MNAIYNKSIAIVGGGPGGLTLARLLQLRGADVKVYERDLNKDARVQGATLDLHDDSGLRAIREAGLTESFQANFRPGADKIRVLDRSAVIVFDEHVSGKGYPERPEIDRGPLRKILLESLKPETVQWNRRFVSLTADDKSWLLHFENAPDAKADIVIAADGANSRIRQYITPIKPFYSGVTAIEGAVYDSAVNAPKMHGLLKGGKIFAMGDEKTLIVSSKGDGSMAFYTGAKKAEHWVSESGIDFSDRARVLSWFKNDFASWSQAWEELLENAQMPLWPRPQYCMPVDQSWKALPNLTMLGDAAHLMPPYAGEGVNLAMLDAVDLSHSLTGSEFPDAVSAIAHYETEMRRRASETAAITMDSTAGLHGEDGIGYLLRIIGRD